MTEDYRRFRQARATLVKLKRRMLATLDQLERALRPPPFAFERGGLLPEGENFESRVAAATEEDPERAEQLLAIQCLQSRVVDLELQTETRPLGAESVLN